MINVKVAMGKKKHRRVAGYVGALVALMLLGLCVPAAILFAQTKNNSSLRLDTGEQVYKAGCVACHGFDGTGTPKTISGFEPPRTFPDFTKCDQTTPEPNTAWKAVIVHGGLSRGFSPIMPSFGEALTSEQIDRVIKYMRGFCRNSHWARGELNLPRAFATEKAFPEDELVITTAINAQRGPAVMSHIVHEQRFGVKNQIEVDVPITFADEHHTWYGGVGDTTLGLKREIFSSLTTGSIVSLFGGLIVPSGNKARGFGTGTTTFETFASYGQLFPTNTFLQFQLGADLPRHTDISPQSMFWRTAVGQSFVQDHGLGRVWSPMIEFLANRNLATGARTDWDVLPQMQVTISKRQHIRANLGIQVPVNNTSGRSMQVMFYVLWDWADGRLNEGW
jgi:mono/diheme cytochrome c family protein